MSVMTDDSIGKVETSPGRRTRKVRAEQAKRRNPSPPLPLTQRARTDSVLRNDEPRPRTKTPTSQPTMQPNG